MPAAFSLSPTRDAHLDRYVRAVRAIPRLTPEREAELLARYRDGDALAGEQLVMANLRTVVAVALRYHAGFASMFDLVQEGNVGLLRALDRYDPTRGLPFSVYARYWIRAMILRFVMENHRLVKVGRTRASRRAFFQLARERAALEAGEAVGIGALARRLDVEVRELDAILRVLAPEESLDAPCDDAPTVGERLVGPVVDPEAAAERRERIARLRQTLEVFADSVDCERERAVLTERLLADDPVSLAELGRRFGVSRERMRQIADRLQERIRVFLLDELGAEVERIAA